MLFTIWSTSHWLDYGCNLSNDAGSRNKVLFPWCCWDGNFLIAVILGATLDFARIYCKDMSCYLMIYILSMKCLWTVNLLPQVLQWHFMVYLSKCSMKGSLKFSCFIHILHSKLQFPNSGSAMLLVLQMYELQIMKCILSSIIQNLNLRLFFKYLHILKGIYAVISVIIFLAVKKS